MPMCHLWDIGPCACPIRRAVLSLLSIIARCSLPLLHDSTELPWQLLPAGAGRSGVLFMTLSSSLVGLGQAGTCHQLSSTQTFSQRRLWQGVDGERSSQHLACLVKSCFLFSITSPGCCGGSADTNRCSAAGVPQPSCARALGTGRTAEPAWVCADIAMITAMHGASLAALSCPLTA